MRSLNRTDGLRDVLALASAVGVVGASFGALAAAAGLSPALTVGMSLLVFAGGSQFLVVSVVAAGGSPLAAVVAGLLINARHLPFGLAVAPAVGRSWPARLFGAHILIDESTAYARSRPGDARRAFWTSGVALFVFWNLGTVVGLLGGSAVPDPDAFGIDAAFPRRAARAAAARPARRRHPPRRARGRRGRARRHPVPAAGPPGADRPARPGRRRAGGAVNWPAVLALAAGTYLMRLSGLVLRDRMALSPRVERLLDLGATALLVALLATAALTQDGGFAGWARTGGVAAGALAAWRRVPFVLVVVLAAATTAGLRLLGVP